ncbi:terminase, partial [Pseudomonas sp. CCC2.2]|nr:terminase [Pseudomonas sp. CCC2.2]
MGKRHPNLPAWQWRSNPQSNHSASHQALSLIAVP